MWLWEASWPPRLIPPNALVRSRPVLPPAVAGNRPAFTEEGQEEGDNGHWPLTWHMKQTIGYKTHEPIQHNEQRMHPAALPARIPFRQRKQVLVQLQKVPTLKSTHISTSQQDEITSTRCRAHSQVLVAGSWGSLQASAWLSSTTDNCWICGGQKNISAPLATAHQTSKIRHIKFSREKVNNLGQLWEYHARSSYFAPALHSRERHLTY